MNLFRQIGSRIRRHAIGFLAPLVSWWTTIYESYPGAWQQNVTVDRASVTAYWAFFACVTLIAKDISKLFPQVMQFDKAAQIWRATDRRPVLQRPNRYQNYLEFLFDWMRCLLLYGNTYVLKERNAARQIVAMYVLDPCRVSPLVASDGAIYYQLNTDNLAGVDWEIIVPASEIIHDRMYTLHHPLIGVSPVFACGVAAAQGVAIQNNSQKFFENMSRPSGILSAPGSISDETAGRLKTLWESNFGGDNIGKIAVLGDDLKYQAMTITAHDSQLIEQLKMTAEMICACFHVPGYKIGVGQAPTVNNTASLNQQYYDQCLQFLIEKLELRLNEGLELEFPFEVQMDLKGLLRMDPQARYASHNESVAGGWVAPNEPRREENLEPVAGGDTPYLQQQNFSLAALAKRDAREDPFATAAQPAPKAPAQLPAPDAENSLIELIGRELKERLVA